MSVSEEKDENWSVPTSSRLRSSKTTMIDLETVPESDVEEEEDDVSTSEDTPTEERTLEQIAAETIIAMSSACLDRELEVVTSSETIIIHWFAETVDTLRENLDQKLASILRNQACFIEEIDYFESMTIAISP
ncbi:hypothetical protein DY000_02045225 [Brassica cretica]|uniref:Uncharacterized protein n=1 Tax=Brassica cretica TaxID=69181 RepID=A0ABQ7F4M1_BRACR|nr:hypothetical protein DY000_02045225 [Brassica cretica]